MGISAVNHALKSLKGNELTSKNAYYNLIRIKIQSLNVQIYVSNKFILNYTKSDF